MFHPLIQLLTRKPHLVAHHLGGYVALASAQVEEAAQALQMRVVWTVGAAFGLCVGALLGGVALLFAAAVPMADMPAPWLLGAAPGVPLLAGALCWMQARRRPVTWSLEPMRQQLAADAALLADVDNA